MSQLSDLDPLDMVHEADQSDYLAIAQMIDDAMIKLGNTKVDPNAYPNFYDAALKQLIDLVPLE